MSGDEGGLPVRVAVEDGGFMPGRLFIDLESPEVIDLDLEVARPSRAWRVEVPRVPDTQRSIVLQAANRLDGPSRVQITAVEAPLPVYIGRGYALFVHVVPNSGDEPYYMVTLHGVGALAT